MCGCGPYRRRMVTIHIRAFSPAPPRHNPPSRPGRPYEGTGVPNSSAPISLDRDEAFRARRKVPSPIPADRAAALMDCPALHPGPQRLRSEARWAEEIRRSRVGATAFIGNISLDSRAPGSARRERSAARKRHQGPYGGPCRTRARSRPPERSQGRSVRPRPPDALAGRQKNAC
jgi:hypothetical protein